MSIVPVSRLSLSDLAILGNNVAPARALERRHKRLDEFVDPHFLAAVQRSLASVGESVTELYSADQSLGGQSEC